MPDQADDLRRFVAEQKSEPLITTERGFPEWTEAGKMWYYGPADPKEWFPEGFPESKPYILDPHRLTSLPPETAEVYRAKLMTGKWNGAYAPSLTDDLITYSRLWLDLKRDLEAEADTPPGHKYQRTSSMFSPGGARRVLDRMEQAETLAFYAHVPPATPETFESVREGMRVKG